MTNDYKDNINRHDLGQGKEYIEPFVPTTTMSNYSNLKIISEGYYEFISFDDDDYYNEKELHGIMNYSGKEIVPPYFDSIITANYENSIYFIGRTENQFYLYDQKGNSIEWNLLQCCGVTQIYKFKMDDKEISISNHGEIIIPPLYDKIENIGFKLGWFKVQKNNLWGIWNNNGELLPPKYDNIYYEVHRLCSFKNYYELNGDVYEKHDLCNELNGIILKEGNRLGFIDYSEKIIIPKYQDIKIIDSNYLAVKIANKWGIINHDEEIIIMPQYKEFDFSDNIFIVQKDNSYGCINIKNEIILPFIYNIIIGDYYNEKLHARIENKKFVFDFNGEIISEANIVNCLSKGYEKFRTAIEYDSRNINLFTDEENTII